MEKTTTGHVRDSEQGSALIVVVMALVLMLPLAMLLMSTAFRWRQQAQTGRDLTALDYAVRAGYVDAHLRLEQRRINITPTESTAFETEVDGITVRVRVERQPDTVLSLGGRVLSAIEAQAVNLDVFGFDPTMRRVRQYRRLEVFLVESRADRSQLPTVRLSAVLVRAEEGPFQQAGLIVERGYFDELSERGLEFATATGLD